MFKYSKKIEKFNVKPKIIVGLFLAIFLLFTSVAKADVGLMNGKFFTGETDNYLLWLQTYDKDTAPFYTDRFFIDKLGNVGINTITPSSKLDVNGTGYFSNTVTVATPTASAHATTKSYVDSATALPDTAKYYLKNDDLDSFINIDDNMTIAEIAEMLGRSSTTGMTKVDDSTAPAPGAFEVSGYQPWDSAKYWKIDQDSEYIFETWIKVMSSTATTQRFYAGWTMYNSAKTSFGNVQRYWGSAGTEYDSNSYNDGQWHHVVARISGVGAVTGNFIDGTEYAKLVLLFNYSSGDTVTRYAGMKLYKSKKIFTSIYAKDGSYSTVDSNGKLVMDYSGNVYPNNLTVSGTATVATPLSGSHAATKDYVDSAITGGDLDWAISGNNMYSMVSGNIGIGTSGPGAKLTLQDGSILIKETGSVHGMTSYFYQNTVGSIGRINTTLGGLIMYGNSSSDATGLEFRGIIGSETPSATIPAVKFRAHKQNGTSIGALSDSDMAFQFLNNSTSLISILGSGNVGIGTTVPREKLHIGSGADASFTSEIDLIITRAGASGLSVRDSTNDVENFMYAGIAGGIIGTGTNHKLFLRANNTNVITLDTSGNVGINDTTPSYKLDVNGTGRFTNTVVVATPTSSTHATTKSYVDGLIGGGIGTGTSGQTLRHDGSSWISNSNLYNNGTNIGIGTSSPRAILEVAANNGISASIVAGNIIEVAGLSEVAQAADITITGGTLVNGGPTARNGLGYWNITSFPSTITLDTRGWWTYAGMSFTAENVHNYPSGAGNKLPANFLVEASANGTDWTTVENVTGYTSALYYVNNVISGSGKFVRITATAPQSGETAAKIANIQVFNGDRVGKGPFSISAEGNAVFIAGNVGIDVKQPVYKLDVGGTARFSNTVTVATPTADVHAATKAYVDSAITAGDLDWTISGNNQYSSVSGNVGIGAATPAQKFHVNGNARISNLILGDSSVSNNPLSNLHIKASASATFRLEDLDNGNLVTVMSTDEGSGFKIEDITNSNVLFFGNEAGNVGIGTTNPFSTLDVTKTENNSAIAVSNYAGGLLVANKGLVAGQYAVIRLGSWSSTGSDGSYIQSIGNANNDIDLVFGEYGSGGVDYEYMRIKNGGNVGINDPTPTYKLDINGTGRFTNTVVVATPTASTHATTKSYVDGLIGGGIGTGTSGQTLRHDGSSWIANSILVNNGNNIGIGTTSPGLKLDVIGSMQQSEITSYSGSVVTTGTLDYKDINWKESTTILDRSNQYKLQVYIGTDTSSASGATYLIRDTSNYIGDAVSWETRLVSQAGTGGANVFARIDPTNLDRIEIWHTGAAAYTLRYRIEATRTYNNNSGFAIFGSDYMWQRSINNLYYTDGNVGINDTTPTYMLDVNGTSRFTQPVIVATPTSGSHATTKDYVDGAITGGDLDWTISGNNQYSSVSGNVGIGTVTPNRKLDVQGDMEVNTPGSGLGYFANNNAGTDIFSLTRQDATGAGSLAITSYSDIGFKTGATTPNTNYDMFIDSTGNVGIGTTSTGDRLHVKPTSGEKGVVVEVVESGQGFLFYPTGYSETSGASYFRSAGAPGVNHGLELGTASNNDIYFQTSGVTKMTILGGGNVGINDTTPSYRLDVNGTARFTNTVTVATPTASTHATTKSYVDGLIGGGIGTGTSGQTLRHDGTSWISNSNLYNDGTNVGIGTTAPGAKLDVSVNNFNFITKALTGIGIGGSYDERVMLLIPISEANETAYNKIHGKITATKNGGNVFDVFDIQAQSVWNNTWASFSSSGQKTDHKLVTCEYNGVTWLALKFAYGANPYNQLFFQGFHRASLDVNGDALEVISYYDNNGGGVLNAEINNSIADYTAQGGYYFGGNLATAGSVGIGDTTPSYKLDVNGTGRFTNTVTVATPTAGSHATTKDYVDGALTAGDADWAGVSGDPTLTGSVYHTGRVGIGTNNPGNQLSIYKDTGTYTPSAFNPDAHIDLIATQSDGDFSGIRFRNLNANREAFFGVVQTAVNTGDFVWQGYNGSAYSEYMRLLANGNVGIGTANPGAKLQIDDATDPAIILRNTIENNTNSGHIALREASAAGYGGFMKYDGNANVFHLGTRVAGTDYNRISIARDSGNVGINDTTPNSYRLDVNGTSRFTQPVIVATPTADTHATTKAYVDSAIIGGDLDWNISGNNMYSGVSGNIGIGTASPDRKLEITLTTGGVLRLKRNDVTVVAEDEIGTIEFYSNDADTPKISSYIKSVARELYGREAALTFGVSQTINTDATEAMRIDENGNVGIGTTIPGARLQINSLSLGGTINDTVQMQKISSSTSNSSSLEIKQVRTATGADWTTAGTRIQQKIDTTWMGYMQFNGSGNNYGITFGTGSTTTSPGNVSEKIRIDSAGDLGIGTANPTYKLHVQGTGYFSNTVAVGTPTAGAHATTKDYVDSAVTGATDSDWIISGNNQYSGVSGNVGIGTTNATEKLQVTGNLKFTSGMDRLTFATYLSLQSPLSSSTGWKRGFIGSNLYWDNTAGNWVSGSAGGSDLAGISFDNGGDMSFITATGVTQPTTLTNVEVDAFKRLIVKASGNVGIGSTFPAYKLDVNGTVRATAFVGGLTGTVNAANVSAGEFGSNTGGGNYKFPANVSIGTAASSYALDIYGNMLRVRDNADAQLLLVGTDSWAGIGFDDSDASGANYLWYNGSTQTFAFGGGGANGTGKKLHVDGAMTIGASYDSSSIPTNGLRIEGQTWMNGAVAIGTTSPGTNMLKVAGDVEVTGTLTTQTGADFAEEFEVAKILEPGTVVIVGDLGYKSVKASSKDYDSRVVGVVSGNPSIIAGIIKAKRKVVVAMVGVVKVKITDKNGIIKKGDLLTTSSIEGYAMKATSPQTGTIIGKALEDASNGNTEIMALINLQ